MFETLSATEINSCNTDCEAPLDGFEGPEKRLEAHFTASTTHPTKGLRHLTRDQWQDMLDLAKCTIISVLSNSFVDSYVLSESSLFVYKDRIMLKTCGTTTLLRCLDKLEQLASTVGCRLRFVVFSRKNYNFPAKQLAPHTCFEEEIRQLDLRFDGSAHVLGPVVGGGDHHCVYFSRRVQSSSDNDEDNDNDNDSDIERKILSGLETTDAATAAAATATAASNESFCNLEILMSELSPETMRNFYRSGNDSWVSAKETTRTTGLADLLPDMETDEHSFEPCGYSVNGISSRDGSLFTVHVTPEPHCSFVSFETSAALSVEQRDDLVQRVVNLFQPGRFSVVVTCSRSVKTFKKPFHNFACRFKTQYEYDEGFHVLMANYSSTKIQRKTSRATLFL